MKREFAARPLSRAYQALVGEQFQALEHLHRQPVAAYRLCRFQGPAADENAEPYKQNFLAVIQQVVAPIDCASHGLLAGWPIACAACEDLEAAR